MESFELPAAFFCPRKGADLAIFELLYLSFLKFSEQFLNSITFTPLVKLHVWVANVLKTISAWKHWSRNYVECVKVHMLFTLFLIIHHHLKECQIIIFYRSVHLLHAIKSLLWRDLSASLSSKTWCFSSKFCTGALQQWVFHRRKKRVSILNRAKDQILVIKCIKSIE